MCVYGRMYIYIRIKGVGESRYTRHVQGVAAKSPGGAKEDVGVEEKKK